MPLTRKKLITEFHTILCAELDALANRYSFQIVYVVDRCADRSFSILKALAERSPNMTVLHLSRRFGHQMSLVAGIDQSQGDAVIMMDSDLQHPPAVIPRLLEKFEEGYEVVHTIRHYDRRVGGVQAGEPRACSIGFIALHRLSLQEGVLDFRLVFQQSSASIPVLCTRTKPVPPWAISVGGIPARLPLHS